MLGQIHLFDVYVPVGDVYVQHNVSPYPSPLHGRFCHNTLNTRLQALPEAERKAMLAGRRLQYPASYDMPDNARVYWFNDPTAEGRVTIWNVQEETEGAWHGVGGRNVVNTCQIEKIDEIG